MVVIGVIVIIALLAWFGVHKYKLDHPQMEEEKDTDTK